MRRASPLRCRCATWRCWKRRHEVVLRTAANSATPTRALLIAGKPLREPIAQYGPFVMNTREQLIQAVEDFQSGRLA